MAQSKIAKGAIISYVAIFLNLAITFFYTPWMIRQIGVSDYGLYSLVYSFISYFILDFGLHQAIQRFIAKYELPFHLIADTDLTILKAYEAWGKKKMYGKETEGTLRTTYVIDEKGVIVDAIGKVDTKNHTEQVLGIEN